MELVSSAISRTRPWSSRPAAGCDAVVNFAADARRPLDPRAAALHPNGRRAGDDDLLEWAREQARGTSRSRPTRCTATFPRRVGDGGGSASAVEPYAASKAAATCRCSPSRAPTASTSRHRGANNSARTSTRKARAAVRHERARRTSPARVRRGHAVRECYAEDHCAGTRPRPTGGRPGEVYNVGGEDHENLEVTHRILELTGSDRARPHCR